MRVSWWYDDCAFYYSQGAELALARLSIGNDGRAQILMAGGEVREFDNADEAAGWLLDEEYRQLDDLIEDRKEDGLPADPRIQPPPAGATAEELARHMVIKLEPIRPATRAAPADSGTPAERLPTS